MYVYSTYLRVIGVIIKTMPVFVLNWRDQETVGFFFYNTVDDTDTSKTPNKF